MGARRRAQTRFLNTIGRPSVAVSCATERRRASRWAADESASVTA